jgi:hypothetical protein
LSKIISWRYCRDFIFLSFLYCLSELKYWDLTLGSLSYFKSKLSLSSKFLLKFINDESYTTFGDYLIYIFCFYYLFSFFRYHFFKASLLDNISFFKVHKFNGLMSDHCKISMMLNINCVIHVSNPKLHIFLLVILYQILTFQIQ